jgi:hypothetical protein
MTTQVGTADEHRRNSHEFWERMAKSWERHRDLGWRSTRDVSEWLVERVDPGPGQTLLDLGAGTGETGFLAAARLGGCRTPDLERLLAADGAGGQQVAPRRCGRAVDLRQRTAGTGRSRDRQARGRGAACGAGGDRGARLGVRSGRGLRAPWALDQRGRFCRLSWVEEPRFTSGLSPKQAPRTGSGWLSPRTRSECGGARCADPCSRHREADISSVRGPVSPTVECSSGRASARAPSANRPHLAQGHLLSVQARIACFKLRPLSCRQRNTRICSVF